MGEQLVFRNREKDGKGECVTEGEELSDEQKASEERQTVIALYTHAIELVVTADRQHRNANCCFVIPY